ncbi:conserved hypothetical protein [Pelobacter propionicus DSM 2379]|uniref:Nitrous oxide-stimulated promoter family protein n=2 Tax=Pelobacter propionicus TaxID=29543 RepID=A1AKS0_PELPD|nr:conserved hypothetical protein [Pelobacter propionicus DSM 2379]
MITTMETMTKRQKKDIRLLTGFVRLYCAGHHGETSRVDVRLPADLGTVPLCGECGQLLSYAVSKRLSCPLEGEKPSCKRCRIHCYGDRERQKIRQVMAWAGKRMIMSGRLAYLWHYLF